MISLVSPGIPKATEAIVLIFSLCAILNAFSIFAIVVFLHILSSCCWSADSTPINIVMQPASFIFFRSFSSRVSTRDVQPHMISIFLFNISSQIAITFRFFKVKVSSINAIVSIS